MLCRHKLRWIITADIYNDPISARVSIAEVVMLQDDEEIVIPTREAV